MKPFLALCLVVPWLQLLRAQINIRYCDGEDCQSTMKDCETLHRAATNLASLTCESPYEKPANLSFRTELLFQYTGIMEVGLNISWDAPTSAQGRTPSEYFVMLAFFSSPLSCSDTTTTACFKTKSKSVVLRPLNTSVDYQLKVLSYTPCAKVPDDDDISGCSSEVWTELSPALVTSVLQSKTLAAPSSSDPLQSSAPLSALSLLAVEEPTTHVPLMPLFSGYGITAVVLLGAAIFAALLLMRRRKRRESEPKRKQSWASSGNPTLQHRMAEAQKAELADQEAVSVHHMDSARCEIQIDEVPRAESIGSDVFVAYSDTSSSEEKESILQNIIKRLSDYGVQASSHDFLSKRGVLAYALEEEICKASTVLCVCNEAFYNEWNNVCVTENPTVAYVRSLLAADLNLGKDISKYAVVLLKSNHSKHIPTRYLNSCKQFFVSDIEDIVRYVAHCNARRERAKQKKRSLILPCSVDRIHF